MKYIVCVKFNDCGKDYWYFTNLNLQAGSKYEIVADKRTQYNTPVTVTGIFSGNIDPNANYRTITSAKLVGGNSRPKDGLNKVIFDEEAGVTVALWCDGSKTIVHCQPGDTFDKEKAIALCYMKKVLGNRGSFNETLKKWVK